MKVEANEMGYHYRPYSHQMDNNTICQTQKLGWVKSFPPRDTGTRARQESVKQCPPFEVSRRVEVSPKPLPGGSNGKGSACNLGDSGLIPGSERYPGEGNDNPFQYCSLEKSHRWRSLVGYSPWGHKELDTTEQLNTHMQSEAPSYLNS